MTPTDPTGEHPPERAGTLAITMALGALAASCYASYRRRTHGAADGSARPAAAGDGAQGLQQSAPSGPAATTPAAPRPSADPTDGAAPDGPSP